MFMVTEVLYRSAILGLSIVSKLKAHLTDVEVQVAHVDKEVSLSTFHSKFTILLELRRKLQILERSQARRSQNLLTKGLASAYWA